MAGHSRTSQRAAAWYLQSLQQPLTRVRTAQLSGWPSVPVPPFDGNNECHPKVKVVILLSVFTRALGHSEQLVTSLRGKKDSALCSPSHVMLWYWAERGDLGVLDNVCRFEARGILADHCSSSTCVMPAQGGISHWEWGDVCEVPSPRRHFHDQLRIDNGIVWWST